MGLKEGVIKGIYGHGLCKPSPIQQKGILQFIQGKDIIVQAQSGTRKTVCFTVSILQIIDTSSIHTQALVITPTREHAQNIIYQIQQIGEFIGIKVHAMDGGTLVRDEIRILKLGVHVVVGTPGKVLDMMKKGFLKTDYLKVITLDEADEMFSRGYKSQIIDIFKHLPSEIQISLFSATMPLEIL